MDGTADDTNVTASDVTVRAAVGHKFVNANFQRHLFVCLFRFYERNCSWYKEAAQAQHCLKTVPKQGFPSPSKCSVMVMLADHLEGFLHYKCNGAVQSLIAWNASLTNASKYTDQLILNISHQAKFLPFTTIKFPAHRGVAAKDVEGRRSQTPSPSVAAKIPDTTSVRPGKVGGRWEEPSPLSDHHLHVTETCLQAARFWTP
ncbi:hypothetical protein O3P69_019462 [Scylla paramamosain]|uniref:RNase H type-1 domain-containing protein n=1 Tax=Scylla paramamosain TaxID=85552 RepID=A0AAW0SXY4_SCYPA